MRAGRPINKVYWCRLFAPAPWCSMCRCTPTPVRWPAAVLPGARTAHRCRQALWKAVELSYTIQRSACVEMVGCSGCCIGAAGGGAGGAASPRIPCAASRRLGALVPAIILNTPLNHFCPIAGLLVITAMNSIKGPIKIEIIAAAMWVARYIFAVVRRPIDAPPGAEQGNRGRARNGEVGHRRRRLLAARW
jgi:hypothetical protein